MENYTRESLREVYESQKNERREKRGSILITILIIAIFAASAVFYVKTAKPELYSKAVSCIKSAFADGSLETVSDKLFEKVTPETTAAAPAGDMLRSAETFEFAYLSSELKTKFETGDFYCMPLENARVTSSFGARTDPVTGKTDAGHHGIDLAAAEGSEIHAFADGVVTDAGKSDIYGNYVTLDHGDITTFYGHMSKLSVAKGDRVKARESIGIIGSTGKSTGVHLHFEVRKDGVRVDPFPYLYEKI